METIQGLNNVFCHSPSGKYQVSSAALSILCRKDRSVAEWVAYAVIRYHNTCDGAKPGLQEHSPASAVLCLAPSLGCGCAAQHSTH